MLKRGSASLSLLGSVMGAALIGSSTSFAAFDGSSKLVCAAIDVVACANGLDCTEGRASDFELPQFMLFDLVNKLVRPTDESGYTAVSPILNSEITDEQIILQGVENHRGWTAAIDRNSGEIAVTAVGADVGFMIFGACTAL